MSFLDISIYEDMKRDASSLNLYNQISDFVKTIKIKSEELNDNRYRAMLTDSIYSIVSMYGDGKLDSKLLSNISKLTELEIIDKDNVNYSGLTQHFEKNQHCKVTINRAFCNGTLETLRTMTHELLHVASKNEYEIDGISSSNLGLGQEINSINEIMTVFLEGEITENYYSRDIFRQEDCTNSYLLNTQGFIHFSNNLRGYDDISEYSKFIAVLEKEDIVDLYFNKFSDVNEYSDKLDAFQRKYKRLNDSLDNLKENRGFSNCFSREDAYIKANNEIFKIIKEKIDNGLSLKEYLELSIEIEQNVRINIGILDDEGNSVITDTLRVMDTYYILNELQSNKDKYKEFISPEMYSLLDKSKNITDKYIYDVLNNGEASLNICSRFQLLRNEDFNSGHTYLSNINEEDLVPYFFEAFKNTKELPNSYILRYDMKDKQMEFNYLSFINGQDNYEKIFKANLNSDFRDIDIIKNKIKTESFKYKVSRVFPFIEYDKRILMDFVKNCSENEYFKEIITELANTNPQMYNDLLNTKLKVFAWDNENQTLEKQITPLQYALDNLSYDKFMIMTNASNGSFDKPELFDIHNVCSNYGKLLTSFDISEKPEISKSLKEKGFETFFDLITIKHSLDENGEVDKTKDIRYLKQNEEALIALIEEDYFRPSEELEKNLEKLCDLGYNELLKDSKYAKELVNTLCLYSQYEIIYNHLDDNSSNRSSLKFSLDEKTKLSVVTNYIIDNPNRLAEVEQKYQIKYDYVLKNAIEKCNFKVIEDILLNDKRNSKIHDSLKIDAFRSLVEHNKISLADKIYNLIDDSISKNKSSYLRESVQHQMIQTLTKLEDWSNLSKFIDSQNISFKDSLREISNKLIFDKNAFSEDGLYGLYKVYEIKDFKGDLNSRVEMLSTMALLGKSNVMSDILSENHPIEIFGNNKEEAINKLDEILSHKLDKTDFVTDVLKNIKKDYENNAFDLEEIREVENIEKSNKIELDFI